MLNKLKYYLVLIVLLSNYCLCISQTIKADDILGNWITPEKDLIVNCYKVNNKYFGKIVWYKRYGNELPDEVYSVPQTKWINYTVMKNFVFSNNQWIDGNIIEIKKGKSYDAYIKKGSKNALVVTGYFMFKFLNQMQYFNRYEESQLPN